jgi:hypothetical protein
VLSAAAFAGAIPAPTGVLDDPNYEFFSPPGTVYQLWQPMTVPRARALQAAGQIEGHLYRYLEQEGPSGEGIGQAPPRAEFDVLIRGLLRVAGPGLTTPPTRWWRSAATTW